MNWVDASMWLLFGAACGYWGSAVVWHITDVWYARRLRGKKYRLGNR